MKSILLVTLVIIFGFIQVLNAAGPVVEVEGFGKVKGLWDRTAWTKQKYAHFLNMPYAEEETERFQPPIPVKQKETEMDATYNYHQCPTITDMETYENNPEINWEDCLYLSVATKNLNSTDLKPVLVYLPGYDLETSDYTEASPKYFLEEDIVFVSIQYRVGVLGFLSTGSDAMPGNIGLLDVVEGLRWVKKNIKHFGGDPERVTISGQYRAAALIHVIHLTNREKLFDKMILQSGSALLNDISTEFPVDIAKSVAENLNCEKREEVEDLNECFKKAETGELLDAYKKYKDSNNDVPYFTIGGDLIPTSLEILSEERFTDLSAVMAGSVKHPSIGSAKPMKPLSLLEFMASFVTLFSVDEDSEYISDIHENFPHAVFDSVIKNAIWPATVDLNSLATKHAVAKAVRLISSNDLTECYLYMFNYRGLYNLLPENEDDQFASVALKDDNLYLFPNENPSKELNKKDKQMAKIMIELWTSFAAKSVPKATGYVDHWPHVIGGSMGPYLRIDTDFEIGWYYPEEFFQTVLEQIHEVINLT